MRADVDRLLEAVEAKKCRVRQTMSGIIHNTPGCVWACACVRACVYWTRLAYMCKRARVCACVCARAPWRDWLCSRLWARRACLPLPAQSDITAHPLTGRRITLPYY